MRIAVTSMGKDQDAEVDYRCARAGYFLIFDRSGALVETVDNRRNVYAVDPPRLEVSQLLADMGVGIVITGRCVTPSRRALESVGISVMEISSATVREAVDQLRRGAESDEYVGGRCR